MQSNTDRYIYFISGAAFLCAVVLVVGLLLHAPMAFAVAVWIVWPVVFAVLVVQLVTSQRLPARDIDSKPAVIVHEDGSIEVQR